MSKFYEIKDSFELWLEGDDRAFKTIFDHFYSKFYALSFKVIKRREDAEELAINALMQVWENKERFAIVEDVERYLFGIIRQQIAGYFRKKVVQTLPIDSVHNIDALYNEEPSVLINELKECYKKALQQLTPQQRKIFLLSREEYFSNKDIAKMTGLSVHTVNNHIKASLKVIKLEFKNNSNESLGLFLLSAICF